jgi:hypothetical protein
LQNIGELTTALTNYQAIEDRWLRDQRAPCAMLDDLKAAKALVAQGWRKFQQVAYGSTNLSLSNLTVHYEWLERAPAEPFQTILSTLPDTATTTRLFGDLRKILSDAAGAVRTNRTAYGDDILRLDTDYLRSSTNSLPWYERRLALYESACEMSGTGNPEEETPLGDKWVKYGNLSKYPEDFRKEMIKYTDHAGPRAEEVAQTCNRIIGGNEEQLRARYVSRYVELATNTLSRLAAQVRDLRDVIAATDNLAKIRADLDSATNVEKLKDYQEKLNRVHESLRTARSKLVRGYAEAQDHELQRQLKFPVLIDSSESYGSTNELIAFGQWMAGLTNQLGNAVWMQLPEESTQGLKELRKNPYRQVVNALVEGDQLAEMEVFFVPPEQDSDNEYIIKVFRVVDVKVSDRNARDSWIDLSKLTDTNSLAKGTIRDGLKISFARLPSAERPDKEGVNESNWGLLQLIKRGEAKSVDNEGKRWRVSVKLEASDTRREGQVVFEVRLKQPLPKTLEVWPKK